MIPTVQADHVQPVLAGDDCPRFFLDAAYDASADDGDWWLDLGRVTVPGAPTV